MCPYIITTTPARSELRELDYIAACGSDFAQQQLERADGVTRLAVATLDEAREAARDVIRALPNPTNEIVPNWGAILDSADLPESGGTVGPLPDGTVIEVRKVGWETFPAWRETGMRRPEIIDAYNAAQEARARSQGRPMIDYTLLEQQRDTLRELEKEIRPSEGPGAFFSDEQADAVAGVAKLVSWMLEYAPEKPAIVRREDELTASERTTVADTLREFAALADTWYAAGRGWPDVRHHLYLLAHRIDPS